LQFVIAFSDSGPKGRTRKEVDMEGRTRKEWTLKEVDTKEVVIKDVYIKGRVVKGSRKEKDRKGSATSCWSGFFIRLKRISETFQKHFKNFELPHRGICRCWCWVVQTA